MYGKKGKNSYNFCADLMIPYTNIWSYRIHLWHCSLFMYKRSIFIFKRSRNIFSSLAVTTNNVLLVSWQHVLHVSWEHVLHVSWHTFKARVSSSYLKCYRDYANFLRSFKCLLLKANWNEMLMHLRWEFKRKISKRKNTRFRPRKM